MHFHIIDKITWFRRYFVISYLIEYIVLHRHTSCRSGSSNKSLCLFRQSFCLSEPDPSKEAKEWPSLTSKVFRTPCKTSKDPESKQQHQCAALFPSSETLLQNKFPEASNCRFSRSAHVTAASAT